MRSNFTGLLIVFLCALNITCIKSPENPNRPKPVKLDFNIRFKVAEKAYEYKLDEGYAFNQWTKKSPGQSGTYILNPIFRILPNNPLNMNVYTLGFNFPSYYCDCNSIDWVKSGNDIFYPTTKSYCFIGSNNLYESPFGVSCYLDDGIVFYWEPPGEAIMFSARDRQPSSSYFIIDSVQNYHYKNINTNIYDFDKIIKGRFKCRVFDVANPNKYFDIDEGEFKFGIWKNGPS